MPQEVKEFFGREFCATPDRDNAKKRKSRKILPQGISSETLESIKNTAKACNQLARETNTPKCSPPSKLTEKKVNKDFFVAITETLKEARKQLRSSKKV